MAQLYPEIDAEMAAWIGRQKVFFVSTAPLSPAGLINCSPKGMDTLRVIDGRTLAYLDLTGSGVETIAHLKENGRVVVMMCALEGPPKIFRFHGTGEVLERGTDGYRELAGRFTDIPGARSIIRVAVERISDSCGYAVPRYQYRGERDTLVRWSEQKGEEGVARYRREKNRVSLDGLEGLAAE